MKQTLTLLIALLAFAGGASAQIYRWVDEKGTVHYSNSAPPNGMKATVFDHEAKAGPPSPDSAECHTVRCQGERLEQRLARQQELDARLAAERAAATPPARAAWISAATSRSTAGCRKASSS